MNITIKTHTTNSSHTHKTAVKYHTNVTQRVLRAHCEWGNSSVNGKKLLSKNSSLYHFEIWNREQITTPQKQNKKKLSILQQQEENILTFKWQKKMFFISRAVHCKSKKHTHREWSPVVQSVWKLRLRLCDRPRNRAHNYNNQTINYFKLKNTLRKHRNQWKKNFFVV